MLINGGQFQDELANLLMEANHPLLGSSANISGTGMGIIGLPCYFRDANG